MNFIAPTLMPTLKPTLKRRLRPTAAASFAAPTSAAYFLACLLMAALAPTAFAGPALAAVKPAALAAADLNGDKAVDAADVQAFLKALGEGRSLPASLDLDGDGTVGLPDALLFGRWVNGLWQRPEAGFAPLQFRNPDDEAVFRKYPQDVEANQGMTHAALAGRHPEKAAPGPGYASGTVEFADRVDRALGALKPGWDRAPFLAQVHREGMAVAPQAAFPNYFQALDFIHTQDLPLLVTTDALLHTVYLSYDNLLIELEDSLLIPALDRILLDARAYALAHHGDGDAAQDVRDLLETALLLLKPGRPGVSASARVATHLADVASLAFKTVSLFGRDTFVDFSQFKPRGHYTRSPSLERYFQAMMWLSRADLSFDLRARNRGGTHPSLARMKKGALLLWDAVVGSGSYPAWLRMNGLLEYMVGAGDGLSLKGLGVVAHALSVRDVPGYVAGFDAGAESAFDAALEASGLGMQAILSQGKVFSPGDPLDLSPILAFMPQRFVLDSYTFSQLVFPVAGMRAMPSSLDIAFALGDNSALTDMASPPEVPAPAGLLLSQRALYDGLSQAGWRTNLYSAWLDFLRKLNPSGNSAFAPAFRTAAWNRKMRNTQLASWAQLRHNTLLYAKQSYTGMVICEFPRAYVEPYPEFFAAVAAYAARGEEVFREHRRASEYFASLREIAVRLSEVAARTARGEQPTDGQSAWLKTALTGSDLNVICATVRVYDGWYPRLIYGSATAVAERALDYTIADVHTKPAQDELGPAQVLHAATGPIHLMAVAVKLDTCVSMFVGPVASYYDVNRLGTPLKRMTDEEWKAEVGKASELVARPAWALPFLGPQ